MKNVWVGTDWHVWSLNHTTHHPYQSVSNIRQLSDSYAKDIQVDDIFIYLGDLCDPAVTDLNELKMLVNNIPGIKILCRGNHDVEKDYFYKDIGFDIVCDICVIGQVVFSHKPIKVEPDQINIHGHLHTEKWSEYDDANHINAYTPDFYKHPLSITEILHNAYTKFLKTPKIPIKSTDTTSIKGYTDPVILDLTSEFEEYMLSEAVLLDEAPAEASISYLMSLSTVDTDEKLLKWVKQNLHVGPMGKVKTDMQMATSHVASDFDIALFVHPRLKKLGHNPRMMILIGYEPKNPKPGFVHLFNYWTDIDDSATWFEASWRGHEGIHEFDSIEEMKEEILAAYNGTPEATKYTETVLRAVNPACVKPGNDPQDILKNIFGETGLTESLNSSSEKESIIVVNGVPEPYDAISSSVDWFCNMLQIPTQVINIKLLNNVRKVWAECIPGSSPFGGRGKDSISVLLDEKYIPEGFDKPSIKKFVCFFDILVTGANNLTGDIAAAIAYWYSQPYYDQCFNELPEHLQPNKDVQKAFNSIQIYQRLMNDTAVDMLVRELYWNDSEDPKILISSVAMNAAANTYGNQKTPYDNLLSISEAAYERNELNEILMDPEDAHLFLADDEVGEKSQKPYKERLSTDDEGVIAESVYDIDKYRKLYNFDEGEYKNSFRGDTKLTSLVEDLLDANIKVSPESINRVALSNVKSAEGLVKYFTERIDDLTESDSFIASGFIFATLLNTTNGSMNLEKFSDFVPTNLSEDEFSKYMEKRFNELKLIDSIYQEVLKNNIANYALGTSLSSDDILKAKAIIDSDEASINTDYALDTVKYSYGDGFATVFINKNIYNQYGSLTLKLSRLYGRASMYDYIIITHGRSDPSSDKWKIEPITINRRTFVDAKSIVSYLGKNASVLFLTCNPDGKLIEGYPKLTYSTTNTLFEKASLTKSYDMINKTIDQLNKRKRQLKTIYIIFNKWYHKHHPVSYPKYVYPQIEFTRYSELALKKVKFTNDDEFYSVGNSILRFINDYQDMLTKSIYILRLFVKAYYNLIPENGYYWIAEKSNKKILTPGVSTINPIIIGNVSTLEECYQEILEFYENDDSLIEHWGDIAIYKNHKNSDTVYTNECAHITFDSIINEDAYQLQGIDRDQQDAISKKYGIRAVGHETDEEREFREKQEREAKERKRLAEKKKKDKQLAKARATKKKYAKKRELEAKREAFKDKFHKKNNEDVDISDIPYNDGSVNFFDNTPGVANFDFANETGYQFEMLDKVKFIDPINESADDRILYPVYVLCVHTGTLLANAIKKATGSHFSHCTISFDSSLKNMYSFGRKVKMTELSNGSFVKESIHNPPYTNEGVNYALYCIPVTASQITAMKKRLEYFVKNKTKFRYDFAGLFKNFFGIADNPEQRWFCSRFVADIINAGTEPGQKPLIREPSLMRPEDFLYTNFALYVTSGLIKEYDQLLVDKVTKKLLRIESIRRAQQRAVQATNIPVTESAVLDLNPYDPNGDMILDYQLTTMDESAFNELKKYMKSFKIKLDKDGNIIIHRREVDQLDKYFREANQLLKMSKKANNQQGVIDQLCRVYYMINIIDRYYLNSTMTKNNTVKMDLKKELVDLRSVMLNVFQQYLKWITEQNPQFNFQKVYDNSIYSDTKVTIPKQLITDIGKAIVTLL